MNWIRIVNNAIPDGPAIILVLKWDSRVIGNRKNEQRTNRI
jgi:hypothetical protein